MVLDLNDEALVSAFHEEIVKTVRAIEACNKRHRGRPFVVKKTYLEENFPDQAEVALQMIQGNQSIAYQNVAIAVLARRYPEIHTMPAAAALELA